MLFDLVWLIPLNYAHVHAQNIRLACETICNHVNGSCPKSTQWSRHDGRPGAVVGPPVKAVLVSCCMGRDIMLQILHNVHYLLQFLLVFECYSKRDLGIMYCTCSVVEYGKNCNRLRSKVLLTNNPWETLHKTPLRLLQLSSQTFHCYKEVGE